LRTWTSSPVVNIVYEAVKRLTRNGETPVVESELLSDLERHGYKLSPMDLAKALIILEILGYVSVRYSTSRENLVYLVRRSPRDGR